MNSQFAVAVHVLSLIHAAPGRSSSAEMAASIGTNPVVVRTLVAQLRRAGLLRTQRGVSGARLTRDPAQVTLLDVYRAVNGPDSVFRLHARPHPDCPVGANIHAALDARFSAAQAALEAELARSTLADLTADLARRAG